MISALYGTYVHSDCYMISLIVWYLATQGLLYD